MSAQHAQRNGNPRGLGTGHHLLNKHPCRAALQFSGSQQRRCMNIRDLGVKQKRIRQPQRCSQIQADRAGFQPSLQPSAQPLSFRVQGRWHGNECYHCSSKDICLRFRVDIHTACGAHFAISPIAAYLLVKVSWCQRCLQSAAPCLHWREAGSLI